MKNCLNHTLVLSILFQDTDLKKKLLWLPHLECEQGRKPMVIVGNSLSRSLGIKFLYSHWISYYKWAIPPLLTVILWQVPAPIEKYADCYLFFEQNVLEWKFIPSLMRNRNMFKGKHHLLLADGKLTLKRITCTGKPVLQFYHQEVNQQCMSQQSLSDLALLLQEHACSAHYCLSILFR